MYMPHAINFCSDRSVCKHIERVYLEAQQRLYAHQESLSESSVAVQIQSGCVSAIVSACKHIKKAYLKAL